METLEHISLEYPFLTLNENFELIALEGNFDSILKAYKPFSQPRIFDILEDSFLIPFQKIQQNILKADKAFKTKVQAFEINGEQQFYRLIVNPIEQSYAPVSFYRITFERILLDESIIQQKSEKTYIQKLQSSILKSKADQIKQNIRLNELESNFRAVLNNRLQALILLDRNYKVLDYNELYAKMTDELYEQKVAKGDNFLSYVMSDAQRVFMDSFEQVLAGEILGVEYSVESKKGIRYFMNNLTPYYNNKNEVQIVSLSTVDITNLRNTEIEHRQNLQLIDAVFNTTEIGIAVFDESGKYIKVNKGYSDITGYSKEELLSNEPTAILDKKQHKKVKHFHEKIIHGEIIATEDWNIKKKSGESIVVSVESHLLEYEDGRKFRVSSLRDITLAKEAQKKLQKSEARLKEAQKIARMGNWEFYPKQKVKHWSEGLFMIREMDVLQGMPSLDVQEKMIHPEDRDFYNEVIQMALDWGTPYNFDYRLQFKDGRIKHINVIGKAELSKNGKVKKLYGTEIDITNRKEIEEEILEKNQELQKINKELDRFVYSASHDLRAPLTSIMGLLYLVKTTDNIAEKDEYINHIDKSVNKLDSFIKDIINYSRNSRLELEEKQICFKTTINEALDVLKFMDNDNEIQFDLNIVSANNFYSDERRINIILSNIISNAIRYSSNRTEKSFIKIDVQFTPKAAIINISDNGIGIAKEHQEHIFEMFYRANKEKVGSGLGLFIVAETVKMLNGSIELESELGFGTNFKIAIPNMRA